MKAKKVYFSIIPILLLVFLLGSCQKPLQPEGEIKNDFNVKKFISDKLLSTNKIDFIGTMSASSHFWGPKSANSDVLHYLYKCRINQAVNSPNTFVNVAAVKVADYDIATPDSLGIYYASSVPTGNVKRFGKNTRWKIGANSTYNIPAFDTTMYVPKELIVQNYSVKRYISRSTDFTINWNQDANNNRDMYIVLTEDTDNVGQNIFFWSNEIPDNGSFTISKTVFSNMSVGASFKLVLIRGNGMIVEKNGKNFLLLGYSYISQSFVLNQ